MDQSRPETLRASTVVVALVLVVIVAVTGAYAALVRYDLVGLGYLPRVAVFALILLLLANAAAAKVRGRRLFSTAQMAFIYVAILVMAGFPGQQLATYLYLGMLGSIYYATPENRYQEIFFRYVPDWLVPSKDPASPVVHWAFEGVPAGAHVPWWPWVGPLLAWTPLLLALLALQVCTAALLRRRWVEEEKLTFPLARIPVDIMSYSAPGEAWPIPLRKPVFWAGFAVPAAIQSLYTLHQYFPQLPYLDLNRNIGSPFSTLPWNQLNGLPYGIYFGMLGVTALIPTDIGFSLWFFWIVRRLMAVARAAFGADLAYPFFGHHGVGAYIALGVVYLYMARGALTRAARSLWRHGVGATADGDEPLPVRMALLGALVSIAVIVGWGWLAGAHPLMVLLMVALWLTSLVVLTRAVSEAGILVVWTAIGAPQIPVVRALGLEAVGPRTVTVSSFMGWKMQDSASATIAAVLQGYRIGGLVRARPRAVFWLIAASLVVALFASHPASLATIYHFSVPKLGWWPRGAGGSLPSTIAGLISVPVTYEGRDYASMASGAAAVGVMHALRMRLTWFPLSPLAYAFVMGPGWAIDRYGFSIFLGWAMKAAALWGGGRKGFESLRYISLGIIAGDAVGLMLWTGARYVWPLGEALIRE